MIISNLGRLLSDRGLTAKDLNEDTHLSNASIRKLLDGSAHLIEFDVLEAICDYLNCSVGDVLEHSSP